MGKAKYKSKADVKADERDAIIDLVNENLGIWGSINTLAATERAKTKEGNKKKRADAERKRKQEEKEVIKKEKKEGIKKEKKNKQSNAKPKQKKIKAKKSVAAKPRAKKNKSDVLSTDDELDEDDVESDPQWRKDSVHDDSSSVKESDSENYSLDDIPIRTYVVIQGQNKQGDVEPWVGHVMSVDDDPSNDEPLNIRYLEPEVKGAHIGQWKYSRDGPKYVHTDISCKQVIALVDCRDFITDWSMTKREWTAILQACSFYSE